MANDISISSSLPGEEVNALKTAAKELMEDPRRLRLIVAIVSVEKTTANHDKGWQKPTLKLRHVELVSDARVKTAQKLLTAELQARTGKVALPFEPGSELALDFPEDESWTGAEAGTGDASGFDVGSSEIGGEDAPGQWPGDEGSGE